MISNNLFIICHSHIAKYIECVHSYQDHYSQCHSSNPDKNFVTQFTCEFYNKMYKLEDIKVLMSSTNTALFPPDQLKIFIDSLQIELIRHGCINSKINFKSCSVCDVCCQIIKLCGDMHKLITKNLNTIVDIRIEPITDI